MPLNIDWQQILLHLLNFVILAGGLYFLLYKPVKDFMGKRAEQYRELDESSRRDREEAKALRKAAKEKLNAAHQEIAQMRIKAGDEIEAEKQQMLTEARAEARRILETAGKTADQRSKKAIADTNEEIRELAMEAVRKMMLSDENALDRFLDAAESGSRNG